MFSRETQALMDAAVDAIVVVDHRGCISAVNGATRRIFGYGDDELVGANVSMLMPEPDRGEHVRYLSDYQRTGTAKIIGIGRSVIAQRKDGSVFPVRLSVGRIPGAEPPQFVGLLRDTTREHEAEARARMAQERMTHVARMATVGEMAAGVAHEINQPLTAITTYARACERYLDMPEPDFAELREAVREIAAEGQRAGEIIRRLRHLVRNDTSDRRVLDLRALIAELGTLLFADARANDVTLRLRLPAALPRVAADAAQIQQVILILVRNAIEALTELAAGPRTLDVTAMPGDSGDVEIHVTDNGPGISPAVADRLFDPFATTKRNGTGLGLATCRTILQAHGGSIDTRRLETRGASFCVRLPVVEETTA